MQFHFANLELTRNFISFWQKQSSNIYVKSHSAFLLFSDLYPDTKLGCWYKESFLRDSNKIHKINFKSLIFEKDAKLKKHWNK